MNIFRNNFAPKHKLTNGIRIQMTPAKVFREIFQLNWFSCIFTRFKKYLKYRTKMTRDKFEVQMLMRKFSTD